MPKPRETDAFCNAVTFTVAGGARPGNAERPAMKVARRLTDTARASGVADVTGMGDRSGRGEISRARPIPFADANTGHGTAGDPGLLERYLDPDHERALHLLRAANARYRACEQADRQRRIAAGCRNSYPSLLGRRAYCTGAYCQPALQLASAQSEQEHCVSPFNETGCVCGRHVVHGLDRCDEHRDVQLVVLDSDPDELGRLADETQGRWP